MKGFIFSEFTELVEQEFGFAFLDEMIEATQPDSGGVYTSIGTYSHEEMVKMVVYISEQKDIPVPDLLKIFGHFLFKRFHAQFPQFFEKSTNMTDFLSRIDGIIHVEVEKLYEGAKTPKILTKEIDKNTLEVKYASSRKLAPFALGMLEASADHFGEKVDIEVLPIKEDGSETKFIIRKQS
jgi:hypothetical protein